MISYIFIHFSLYVIHFIDTFHTDNITGRQGNRASDKQRVRETERQRHRETQSTFEPTSEGLPMTKLDERQRGCVCCSELQ